MGAFRATNVQFASCRLNSWQIDQARARCVYWVGSTAGTPTGVCSPSSGAMPEKLTVLRAITRLNIGGPATHAILLTMGLQNERFRSVPVSGQEGPAQGNLLDL